MPLPFTAEQLTQHINHDFLTCTQLLEVLKKEQDALKKRDADTVERILESKIPLLNALEVSGKMRQAWAQAANTSSSEAGWAGMLTSLGSSDIKTRWAQLKTLYSEVRMQNEVNGKLLSRHQNTIARLLDVMRGKTAGPNLYNASGYSSAQASGNKFGEA